MQSTILVILSMWTVFFAISLPPSLRRFCLYQNFKISQRTVNKTSWSNPRQTRIWYIFRLWVIIEALLKQIFLYLLSHFRIRIIVLTCPDNKSARNHQPKSCVPAKSHKSQWCEANIISIEIFAPFQPKLDRTFVRNGGTTRTHSSFCSWAGVSEQIANNLLFWLRLSKI